MSERGASDDMRVRVPFPPGILEDRNHDGIPDYLNARIYVAARASPEDLAAAANVAARLCFETLSVDLPLGFPISQFSATETTLALVIGAAARRWTMGQHGIVRSRTRGRSVIAIESAVEADLWARSLVAKDCEELSPWDSASAGSETAPFDPVSLGDIFTTRGLFGQTDDSVVPNTTRTSISIGPGMQSPAVIDLAARIAMETAGLSLPLFVPWSTHTDHRNPVLLGRGHPQLRESYALSGATDPAPGEGRIEIVRLPAGVKTLAVLGGNAEGEGAALRWLACHLPCAQDVSRRSLNLTDIESGLHDFVSVRSAEGQFAAAVFRTQRQIAEISAEPESVRIDLDRVDAGFTELARAAIPARELVVRDTGLASRNQIFAETLELPWEVDAARSLLDEKFWNRVNSGSAVDLDVRLSEPREIRQELEGELRERLLDRGAHPERIRIRVLSAFKQALCWVDESLTARLASARSILIRVRSASLGKNLIDSKARWLQELYPIDEILARDLGLAPDDTRFELATTGPTYRLIARDAGGRTCLDESFEPSFVLRPLFDYFPEYATARVATGWVRGSVDGRPCLDERVPTDLEQVWDSFQRHGQRRLGDYLRALYPEPPTTDQAPHFGTFEVDVEMSEPDHALGVDQERLSTVEGLHEDIYFNTLLFMEILSDRFFGHTFAYPGRIIPRIRTSGRRAGPRITVRLTGKRVAQPGIEIRIPPDPPKIWQQTLPHTTLPRPVVDRVSVWEHSSEVVLHLTQRVPPGSASRHGETAAMLRTLAKLRKQGGASHVMNDPGVSRIDISVEDAGTRSRFSLEVPPRPVARTPRLDPANHFVPTRAAVPLGPSDTEREVARLSRMPGVRAFCAGRSYLGIPLWALVVTSPLPGRFVSQARCSVTKPVLFLTGRQHGNEVSSTSYILQFIEWLVSEEAGRHLLNRVSLVAQPMANPDGAALAAELAEQSPGFMLHAGYFGALGRDVMVDQWADTVVYPEAGVRRNLWEMWKPDVVFDGHGYPSHEWVQPFSGYSAWFRSRDDIRRDWWIPRGAFLPRFDVIRDPRYPQHESTARAIRDRVGKALDRSLKDVNARMYRRYRKYLEACRIPFDWTTHSGILVCSPSPSADSALEEVIRRTSFMMRDPNVTVFQCTIELPDETARGEWLERLTSAGFDASRACMEFLAESTYRVRRFRQVGESRTRFGINRHRPVQPFEATNET